MKKETFKYVMQQFAERDLPHCYRRDVQIPTDSGKVVTLIGARRTGKTFIMFQLMQDLLDSGISREQIIYLNFEDDRLFPVELPDMDCILDGHRELFPEVGREKRYVFFDEIQNVKGWEKYVRRISDTEPVSIFLTGSSSALLQKDMSTAMRGRSITFEVYPLSFGEYLSFRKIEYVPYSKESESIVAHAFHSFMAWGGFPEVVLAEEPLKLLILQEYASLMFHRDLIERYHIRNELLMRMMLKFCAEHTGSLISLNKLYNDFSSQGIKMGKATLYEYMEMLEDSFIVFGSQKYDPSTRRSLQSPQKVHLLDPGLGRAYRTRPERDIGHRFESVIYLHERRRRKDIQYYRNGFELDMCWGDGAGFVNVVWELADYAVKQREDRAMKAGMAMWPEADARLVIGVGDGLTESELFDCRTGWKYLLGVVE